MADCSKLIYVARGNHLGVIKMSTESDTAYFVRREMEERDAAAAATDTSSRDAHLVMAERYADRVAIITEAHFPQSAKSASR